MSGSPAEFRAAIGQPVVSMRPRTCFVRHAASHSCLARQTLAQHQHQHQLSSCIAQLQLQQRLVSCRKHHRSSSLRRVATGAASTDIVAATAAETAALEAEAERQQQPSSNGSAHQVIEVEPEGDSSGSSSSRPNVIIKAVAATDELQAVARLRAEAYYAEDRSRFAESFKRQFAAQEVESLRQRTTASNGRPQLSDCLVALQPGSDKVLGCIDIRLPQTATGMRVLGVPEDDAAGCYLLNVVVDEDWRGQGVGKALMRTAMAKAVHAWGARRLYTHVEADNEVASGLYKGCGFREHSSEEKYANTSALGRLVLLMAAAEDAPVEDMMWSWGE